MENKKRWGSSILYRPEKAAYLFLAPALLILGVFVFFPLVCSLLLSLTNTNLFLTQFDFVGLLNFKTLLADSRVINAFKNTLYFTVMVVPLQVILSLVVASLVTGSSLFKRALRLVYFIPVVCSLTAVGLMSALILDPQTGIIPYAISKLGFGRLQMLKDANMAMPLIAGITVWKNFGRTMIILVAGISTINPSYYEAAMADGASRAQQFFRITVPMLWPSLSFSLVTIFIASFQVFDQVYVTTGGGPMFRTETVVQYIYSRAFTSDTNLGYASSIALVLFVVIAILTLILNGWLRRHEAKIY